VRPSPVNRSHYGESREARYDLDLDIDGAGLDAFKGHGGDVLNHRGHLAKNKSSRQAGGTLPIWGDQRKNIKRTKVDYVT